MKVGVVIPSLASEVTEPYLKLAVESLRASVDWDIVVVTNGGRHKPYLGDIHGITSHLHTRDQGQANATNIGVQVLSPNTNYIFISNDDMYYAPTWKDNLQFDYPVFSPNLVEPENNYGSADPFLKYGNGFMLEDFDRQMVDAYIDGVVKGHLSTQYESGFNFPLFIKKDLWDLLGGYDVAYDPWGSNSDTDLQTRVNLAGVTPMRLRDVLVYHFSNKSGTFDGTHQDFYQNNIEYFKQKFGFDRDELGSDVWMNRNMLPEDVSRIKYKQEKYDKS